MPVSPALREYFLADDGMFLPEDAFPPPAADESDDGGDKEDRVTHDALVEEAVKETIARWGRVTIKIDEVAPTDAAWMMPFGSSCCTTLGHVYMAVKASNRLQQYLEKTERATMRVQRWIGDSPAGEFRCYTSGNRLVFAGQRYPVNSIRSDLIELGKRLHSIWTERRIGDELSGFWEVDLWLKDSCDDVYILGVKEPVREEVEAVGIFTFDELLVGAPDNEPCVVVRAITDDKAMAARRNDGSGAPEDIHLSELNI